MTSDPVRQLRLLTTAVVVAAIAPRLLQRGMFVDGVTYASIARNLAEGRGRFWTPFYTATIYPAFYDHPPLGFWLQSLWFRLLGDHPFVERAYSATAAVLTALLIVRIWRVLHNRGSAPDRHPRTAAAQHDWLPVLLWIAVPVVSWAIVGNLLETTVALFTTAAMAAAVELGGTSGAVRAVVLGSASGLSVACAVLTKGPVGLFPLVVPLVMVAIAPGNRQRWGWFLAAQLLTLASVAAWIVASAEARESLERYVHQQVLAAIGGRRETSASSFTIVNALVQNVGGSMLIVAGAVVLGAKRWVPPSRDDRRIALAFICVGLAGTLPILASTKQAGHYLVPAVPAYAIGLASLLTGVLPHVTDRLNTTASGRGVKWLSATILVGAIIAVFIPGVGRDHARIADLDAVAADVPRGVVMGICPAANADWGLHAWFERRFDVALDASAAHSRRWFLQTREKDRNCPPPTCTPATDATRQIVVLRCP